jgi:hypothetical protein
VNMTFQANAVPTYVWCHHPETVSMNRSNRNMQKFALPAELSLLSNKAGREIIEQGSAFLGTGGPNSTSGSITRAAWLADNKRYYNCIGTFILFIYFIYITNDFEYIST